ncbi:MAG: glycoside hydrolase family 3 N-terminal domain-containing protein [Pseudanabaenaceae cyanobacterium]
MLSKTLPAIDSLTLTQLVAQMVVIRTTGHLYDHQIAYPAWERNNHELADLIGNYGVGGVILLGGSAAEIYARTQQLQNLAAIPLLITADVEEGVGHRFSGATWFPAPMALEHLPTTQAEAMGRITAQESLAIGINWLFAPIVDINNNPLNPVINVRAFGTTADTVMAQTGAFIRGAQTYPILTTAKHFPGHGDTAVDSHLQTPVLPHSRDRFSELEWLPFRHAIAQGVDAIMTAHVLVPALDEKWIATLSPTILTGILRQEMGFEGLIVTDALIMSGVADLGTSAEVAVQAVKAGADILLMPIDPWSTIAAVVSAVESGEIALEQIKASVSRIWQAKAKVLEPPHPVASGIAPSDPENYWDLQKVGLPESLAVAEAITRASLEVYIPDSFATFASENSSVRSSTDGVTNGLVKALMHSVGSLTQHNAPSPSSITNGINLILVDDPLHLEGILNHNAPAVKILQNYGYQKLLIDGQTIDYLQLDALSNVVVQVFSRGNPFRGSAGLHQKTAALVQNLVHRQQLSALLVYGSPYGLGDLKQYLTPDIPWGFAFGQQPTAQGALTETLIRKLQHS